MICRLILPILGALITTCHTLIFESQDVLRGMVLDERGHIYLGAVNALYQLDPSLNVLNYTITGPVQDNPNCAPPQINMEFCLIEGEEMKTSDNYNQLILIDNISGHLISCGSVFQGTCTARMLEDISLSMSDPESYYPKNYVVSTDPRMRSVGFVGEVEPGKQSLFIGGYVSADDEFTIQDNKKAAIANRKLLEDDPGQSFTYYTSRQRTLFYQRSWHVKRLVDVVYVAAFQDDRFAYFFFHERQLATGRGTESRIARTCLSDTGNTNSPLTDSTYTSYIEIPISCSYQATEYPALSSVKLVSVTGMYGEDNNVLVGTFSNEKNNTQTALCTFSFDEINRQLNAKTLACANGEGVKKIRSEARDNVLPCTNSKTTCTDVCTCNIKNDNYPLEVEGKVVSQSNTLLDGDVTAIAANVVKNQIEVFVGVEHHNLHSLQKYVIESVDDTHLIDDYNTEPLTSKVLQIEVLAERSSVLILTENSVFTRPISVCSSYVDADCHRCIQVRDPHCGWCEMGGQCTPESECTSDVWRAVGECTSITTIEPNMSSMGNQRLGNVVTVTTNNRYPEGTPINCTFGWFGEREATVGQNGQITCLIPYLRPPITGQHLVDFSLISGDIVLASSERAFTFFNCESYTTCTACTGAAVGCGWCAYDNRCDQICKKISEPHQCPALNYSISHIPAELAHGLEITGRNLPVPFVSTDSYTCVINIDGVETRLTGSRVNSTVVCATNHTFITPHTAGEVVAPVKVLWKDKEIEAERQPEVDIYRCSVLGRDCSSCRANSMLRNCGWCSDLSTCLLQTGGYNICPSSYSSVCVGLKVDSFEPKHGPVEGGTLVTIRGKNLGSRPTDITSIKIAGLPCEVQMEGFQVSRAVVCKTSPSGVPKHGLVEVTTSGSQYIFNDFMYFYKKHKVNDVFPRCGIAAGGTDLTISGEELNIGVKMSVIVAGTMCDVTDTATQQQVYCRTRPGVIGQSNLQVNIDGGMVSSPSKFEVVDNPEPRSISANSSISSGGIPVEIRFAEGYKLECVQKLSLIFETVNRVSSERRCEKLGSRFLCKTPTLDMEMAGLSDKAVSYVTAHLKADNHLIALDPFPVHADPVVDPVNNTNADGYIEWPLTGGQQLVLNGKSLNKVPGIEVLIGGLAVATKVTPDHIIFIPPTFSVLKEHREREKALSRSKREGSRTLREADDVTTAPDKRSHDKKYSAEYTAVVMLKLGNWRHNAGKLYYTKSPSGGVPYSAIIIPIAGFIVLVVLLSYLGLKYHRSQKSHRRTLKTVRMHMEKLEMRVANECKDAFTALQTQLTDVHGNVADIPFRPFSDFMANVLFPGTETETKDLLARLSAPSSKVTETPRLAQFRRLLRDRAFLQKFVEVVESDPHFDVANKCKMASLLVIVISNDMGYLTEVLFALMEKLIDKFLAKKNHPQLLLRRTESVADKLLTHWLNYCCYQYLRQHAGQSIFTLFSAIKQQLDLGPQDEMTFEAKCSLNNEKMLRETIEFKTICGSVRDLNKNEHPVTLLTCDSIKQAKRKVIESVHRGKPASQIPPIESFDLMYIRKGNTPVILRENQAPIVEGWRKLSILADYKIEDPQPVLAMIPLSTDSEHSSLSPTTDRRKASFLTTKRYRSKGNLITAGMNTSESDKSEERHQIYHLVKPNNDLSETDTLLSTKMMSEVFLTRLLSTKGTLQPYVDDLLQTVFMSRERVPPCVKYLFDFLERQAQRHNLLHNQAYIHTWKNNSLSLRFWMNVVKNPHFLLDIDQTPTIDSSLNIVCGVFMDSCSTSDKGLTKDSPINKLLYAKDIPRYRKQVQKHYEQVSSLPPAPLDFLTGLPATGLNSTVAVSELLVIANKYQKQLQSSFGPDSPSLNLKFTSVIDATMLSAPNLV